MSIFRTLLRRELSAYLFSLTGYLIIGAVTLLSGTGFVVLINTLGADPVPVPLTELFFLSFYFWLTLLLITPVITMRLFALEKASGTFENLMTTAVTDLQVVGAKFTAAMLFYLLAWLPLLADFGVIHYFAHQNSTLDAGTIGGMYLGIALIGGLFLSLGCFASALTRSQVAAAVISFMLGVGLFSLAYLAKQIPASEQWSSKALSYFGMLDHMDAFARGVVDTRTVVFYVSATFLFLFLTLRVVESRRWR